MLLSVSVFSAAAAFTMPARLEFISESSGKVISSSGGVPYEYNVRESFKRLFEGKGYINSGSTVTELTTAKYDQFLRDFGERCGVSQSSLPKTRAQYKALEAKIQLAIKAQSGALTPESLSYGRQRYVVNKTDVVSKAARAAPVRRTPGAAPAGGTPAAPGTPPSGGSKAWKWVKDSFKGPLLFAIFGGIDDFQVSQELGDSMGVSIGEYVKGDVYGLGNLWVMGLTWRGFSWASTKLAASSLGTKIAGSALGRTVIGKAVLSFPSKLFTPKGGSAVLIGAFIGAIIAENWSYTSVKQAYKDGMAELMRTVPINMTWTVVYVNPDDQSIRGTAKDPLMMQLPYYDGSIKGLDEAENWQTALNLENKQGDTASSFVKTISQANLETETPPFVSVQSGTTILLNRSTRSDYAKFTAGLDYSKIVITDPKLLKSYSTGDAIVYSLKHALDFVTLGYSEKQDRMIVATADNWKRVTSVIEKRVGETKIRLYTLNGSNTTDVKGVYCQPKEGYNMQFTECYMVNPTPGLFIIDYRQIYGSLDFISMNTSIFRNGFDNWFEENNCGLLFESPNENTKKFFCKEALNGMYDFDTDNFTGAGIEDLKEYMARIKQYYDFLKSAPSGYAKEVYPKGDLVLLEFLVTNSDNYANLKQYKYFLAAAMYGLPTFSVVVNGDPANAWEISKSEIFSDSGSANTGYVVFLIKPERIAELETKTFKTTAGKWNMPKYVVSSSHKISLGSEIIATTKNSDKSKNIFFKQVADADGNLVWVVVVNNLSADVSEKKYLWEANFGDLADPGFGDLIIAANDSGVKLGVCTPEMNIDVNKGICFVNNAVYSGGNLGTCADPSAVSPVGKAAPVETKPCANEAELRAKIDSLNGQLDTLKVGYYFALDELDQANAKAENLIAEMSGVQNQRDKLDAQLVNAQQTIDGLNAQVAGLTSQNNLTAEQRAKEAEKLNGIIDGLNKAVADAGKKREDYQKQIDALNAKIDAEKAAAKKALDEANKAGEESKKKILDLQKQIKDKEDQGQKDTQFVLDLRSQLLKEQQESDFRAAEAQAWQTKYNQLQNALDETNKLLQKERLARAKGDELAKVGAEAADYEGRASENLTLSSSSKPLTCELTKDDMGRMEVQSLLPELRLTNNNRTMIFKKQLGNGLFTAEIDGKEFSGYLFSSVLIPYNGQNLLAMTANISSNDTYYPEYLQIGIISDSCSPYYASLFGLPRTGGGGWQPI